MRSLLRQGIAGPLLLLMGVVSGAGNMEKVQGQELWAAYRDGPTGQALKELLPPPLRLNDNTDPTAQPHALPTGGKTMPFYFLSKGDLTGLRPLFIALHGGGSAGGRAPSPHGWPVNTREWNAQARLAADFYPDDALYFVPRMPDDNAGRWYYDYCQDAFDQVIRAAILHHHVDPNRVYLIGISEGAYTAYRLGASMADRWAGAGSMAGGEPVDNAPPENMRNLAFRADIGEHDTMFDRVGLNRRYREALKELQQDDPDGFVHHIEIHQGRGHGIDYTPCPEWLFAHSRNPRPTRIRWKVIDVHGRVPRQSYWLALDSRPDTLPISIDARVDRAAQTVHLSLHPDASAAVGLRVYLDDDMLDLDRPVHIVCNGVAVFEGMAPRRADVMRKSLEERGDPFYMFPAEVVLPRRRDAGLLRVDPHQRDALSAALNKAGSNRAEWLELLQSVADEHLQAAAFLISNMPQRDLLRLDKTFLVEHIEGAYQARAQSPWGHDVPRELFLQYILPYAHFNERRDRWRQDLQARLHDKAWTFKRPVDATIWLNNELNDLFQVYFHATKRPKPDQSPYESIEAGYASCTGLSILLANSCRSVGIPARLVGIPQWTEVRGNHTWVEIWDGQWHNVGGTGSDPRDDDWVNERCRTQTDADQWQHSVYAACFRRTDLHFPLVWDLDIDYVPALNVTRFYSGAQDVPIDIPGGGKGVVDVYWSGELLARKPGTNTVSFSLATGDTYDIRITTTDGQIHRQTLAPPDVLSRDDVSRYTRAAYDKELEPTRAARLAELEAREITQGGKTLKWLEKTFGNAPDGERSLWISMHGGGGAPAQVNEQQWRNQGQLYQPEEGIYLAPRAPTDTWNLWHQAHIDPMFDRLIENFVALRGVNPNKVYLMGYSAGGDGVWQVAPRMADRFAAAAMMAGHPNEASLLGLRNLPFAVFMGANDGAYDRNRIAAEKIAELEKLQAADPEGYIHLSRVYEGSGHWMHGKEKEALPWMAAFTRNPWPRKLVWVQDDVTHERYYWLKLPVGSAVVGQKIIAEVNGQLIALEGDVPEGIRIRLSDDLLNLDQSITVRVHGQERFAGTVRRDTKVLSATLSERLDPAAAASAEIVIQ